MATITNLEVPLGKKDAITIEVDTTTAIGTGPLSAEAFNNEGTRFEIEQQEDDGKFTFNFKPPSPEKYKIHIKWGVADIKDSPLNLNLGKPDSKAVVISEPPSGNLKPGEKIIIGFDATEAGRGEITSTCTAGGSTEIPVEVIRTGYTAHYIVDFLPPCEDLYVLSVKWAGKNIKGSPFKLDMNPILYTKVTNSNLVVPEPGGNIEVDVCTEGAGSSELSATCVGDNAGEIGVDIVRTSPNNFHLSAKTGPQPDKYKMDIRYSGHRIPGSPIEIEVKSPGEGADGVDHLSLDIPEDRNSPVVLKFDTSKAGEGAIRARVTGTSTGPIESTCDQDPETEHVYNIAFKPTEADSYLADVYWNDDPVPGSPFDVIILHPEELVFGEPKFQELEIPVEMEVDASKAGPGALTAMCVGDKSENVEVFVEDDTVAPGSRKYTISFRPSEYDTYRLTVLFANDEVKQSPFIITVKEPEKPEPVEQEVVAPVVVPVLQEEPTAQEPVEPEPVEPEPVEPEPVEPEPVEPEPVEVEPEATVEELIKPEEPIELLIPVTKPLHLFDVSPRRYYNVEEKICFGVNAESASEGKLNINVTGPEQTEVSIIPSQDTPGVFEVVCSPAACGEHKINVSWDEEPFPESPVVFTVKDDSNVPEFPMTRPYLVYFTTDNKPQEVRSYGIHEDSGTSTDLHVGKRRNGKLKCSYLPTYPGIHSLHVLVDDKDIPGSPFRVRFVDSDPRACRLIEVPDFAYVGEETSFKIDTRKASIFQGSASFDLAAKLPPGSEGTQFGHREDNNGIYTVFFEPKVAGKHHFDISWAGAAIVDSPVEIEAKVRDPDLQKAREAADKVHVLKEDRDVFSKKLPSTSPAYICISTGHAGKGKLTLKATGPSEAKITMYGRENSVFTAEVEPRVAGKYSLGIMWDDLHIKGSPYSLDFTADKSHLLNGLDLDNVTFVIDVPHAFHIHCPHDDPEGELSVSCTPTTAAIIKTTPMEHDSDSYSVEIIPKEVGNHEISIKYNDRDVHNSPHYVQFDPNPDTAERTDDFLPLDVSIDMNAIITPPPDAKPSNETDGLAHAFGPGLSDGLVGQEGNFTIETDKCGEGKLEFDVFGPKGAFKINVRRHPDNIRTLLARYDPKIVGKYTISLLWNGEHISSSPYSVNISEQVASKAQEEAQATPEPESEDKPAETSQENKESPEIEIEVEVEDKVDLQS